MYQASFHSMWYLAGLHSSAAKSPVKFQDMHAFWNVISSLQDFFVIAVEDVVELSEYWSSVSVIVNRNWRGDRDQFRSDQGIA